MKRFFFFSFYLTNSIGLGVKLTSSRSPGVGAQLLNTDFSNLNDTEVRLLDQEFTGQNDTEILPNGVQYTSARLPEDNRSFVLISLVLIGAGFLFPFNSYIAVVDFMHQRYADYSPDFFVRLLPDPMTAKQADSIPMQLTIHRINRINRSH